MQEKLFAILVSDWVNILFDLLTKQADHLKKSSSVIITNFFHLVTLFMQEKLFAILVSDWVNIPLTFLQNKQIILKKAVLYISQTFSTWYPFLCKKNFLPF